METRDSNQEFVELSSRLEPTAETEVAPWEMIESGRYRPRRIRGSHRGRELG